MTNLGVTILTVTIHGSDRDREGFAEFLARNIRRFAMTDDVVIDISRHVQDVLTCTGIAARWCPIHGDCTDTGDRPSSHCDDPFCPLHGLNSRHALTPFVPTTTTAGTGAA